MKVEPQSRKTVRSLEDLAAAGVPVVLSPALQKVIEQFGVAVTPAMMDMCDPNDPHDPMAAQFIPTEAELNIQPDELDDPISDSAFSPVDGLVHRYPDRVLLKPLHACAVYCRFCFRREQVGEAKEFLDDDQINAALEYIRNRPEVWEVILSGGDPLIFSPRRLGVLIEKLNAIAHVKVIRIHTRVPVVDPDRITAELVTALRGRAPVYVLLHCNHSRELSPVARAACARLVDAGIPMLSQSVLLRGVNDNPSVLADLMRAFVECRIKPHYIHHGDKAKGTGHFRLSIAEGQRLMRGLRGVLSGLCQPSYMLDLPGGHGKVPLDPVYATKKSDLWTIEDYRGHRHTYNDSVADSLGSGSIKKDSR
jgi:lysine 2,3-aminomutase